MDAKLKQLLARVQKPGRYTGGEPGAVYKHKASLALRFAFCFPDTYEVGMSYLGMKILYELLNDMPGVWCERAFMPWVDMADAMKEAAYPLYALESKDALSAFDVVGFTLQYELSYTNVLAMLDLGGIPLRAAKRGEAAPLLVAGGPCTVNPEPLAPFFDAFLLGEGEEQLPQLCRAVAEGKRKGLDKLTILRELSKIPGVYVPAFYQPSYRPDGGILAVSAQRGAPLPVKKAFLQHFESFEPPKNLVVPMVGAVHDRVQLEVLRGCVRGCRFCQAGFIYRPMRQRPPALLSAAARRLCDNTGYEEVSLTSLSTSDHSELEALLDEMISWTQSRHINLALPSLRVDNFTQSLAEKITKVRKSGLTFAPEAGTQRLRDVINKNVSDAEIDRTCMLAFNAGYTAVKLYFMMGLPTETTEDIKGIADTAQRVVDLYYQNPNRRKGQAVKVSVSVACFVPKPMTPFQYCGQDSEAVLREKQQVLLECLRGKKKISVSWHDSRISFMEAVFARGDRRLANVLERAYRKGCHFDGWDDQFLYETWLESFKECGVDPFAYAQRGFAPNDVCPWDHLDFGVSKDFLRTEYRRAMQAAVTLSCNRACAGCGANALAKGGVCFANP